MSLLEGGACFYRKTLDLLSGDQEHHHWTPPVEGGVHHVSEQHYLHGSTAWGLEPGVTTPTVGENDPRAVTCDVLFYSDLFAIYVGSQTPVVLQCLPTEISDKEQISP